MNALQALATAVVTVMIAAGLSLLLLATPAGSAWLVGVVSDLAGDRLTLTGIRGTLLEGLAVDRLHLTAGRTTVVIEPAEISMSWPDLLRRRLRLTTARADAVYIDIAPRPADQPDSEVQPLILPVVIAVDALEIGRLIIRNGVSKDGGVTADIVPVEIGPVALRGELVEGDLRFEELRVELYGLGVEATGEFGTGEPFPLEARVEWEFPLAGAPVTGSGKLAGDLASLRFEQVVRLPSVVGVGGVVQLLQDRPAIFAEARWTGLERPLGADPDLLLRSEAGRLSVRGWIDDYTAELVAALRLGDRPTAQVAATLDGDTRQVRVPGLRVDGFGGRIAGSGSITLQDELTGRFRLSGQRINPAFVDPRFAGQVDFNSEVSFDDEGNFRVVVPDARGTLFDRPLRASGTVARVAQVLSFDDMRVDAGANRVEFTGKWGARISGQFRIDAPELATLWPDVRGRLRGTGSLGGTTARPILNLDLTGSELAAGDLRIGSLQALGGLDDRQRLAIDAQVQGIAYAGQQAGNLTLGVAGPLTAYSLELALSGGDVEVALAGTGSYRDGIVIQTATTGLVTVLGDQRWTLREPATVRVAGEDVALTAHCWEMQDAEMCLADSGSGAQGFNAGLDLRRFPLVTLSPWLPDEVELAGTATSSMTIRSERGVVTGSLAGSLADAVVTWRDSCDEDVQTELTEFRVDVGLASDVLDFEAAVAESFGLRLAAEGRVTGALGESPVITASISGGVPDLASLRPLVEQLAGVGDLQGRLTVDATLAGNASRPDITGGFELEDGAFTVPAAGIRVDRVSLSALGREDGQVALKGNARSGKGFVALDGALAWRDQVLPSAEATVKGRVIDVINLPQGIVQVSPDVRVVLREGQFWVGGDMLVPRATIKLKRIETGAVQPSPDTIVHGRDLVAAQKAPPLFVLDDLQVRLGEKVTFDGFGLRTGLTGGLRLNQSLGADPALVTGDGVVSLRDGQFTAFGQKLEIERGSLIFSGVVTDPGLDVKASRDVDYEGREVTVGVLLSGNLSRIQTRVFSEPAMGELDALSYLTTGKPLSAAGAGDRSLVASSAISLGLSQALPVVQELGSALSVDEVAFGTSETGDTAVVVGEQLGKNLFIRYSYGIFDKLGTVEATYKLGRRVSIEASSGQEQALDLIYSLNW